MIPLGVPVVSAFVEAFLKPKLAQIYVDNKIEQDMFDLLKNKFTLYLESAIESHSYIKTVVFQNGKKRLLDLYQPLTVNSIERLRSESASIVIDSYCTEFIPRHQRVLLIDDAGMGKSTILRFLFLCCINEKAGLPIFIELRRLKAKQNIIDFIHLEISPIYSDINIESLRKLIELGDFVFFLDGYDEIPDSEREGVVENLQDFISKAHKNQFILSSRNEPTLASFSNFQGFSIQGLKIEEAYNLIRKYGAQGGGPSEDLIVCH